MNLTKVIGHLFPKLQLPHLTIIRGENEKEPWKLILSKSHEQVVLKQLEWRKSVKLFSDVNNELFLCYFASAECLYGLLDILMEC